MPLIPWLQDQRNNSGITQVFFCFFTNRSDRNLKSISAVNDNVVVYNFWHNNVSMHGLEKNKIKIQVCMKWKISDKVEMYERFFVWRSTNFSNMGRRKQKSSTTHHPMFSSVVFRHNQGACLVASSHIKLFFTWYVNQWT